MHASPVSLALSLALALVVVPVATPAMAEQPILDGPPAPNVDIPARQAPKGANTTVIERAGKTGTPAVRLVALLTGDGQQIDRGLVWRVFQTSGPNGKAKLVAESHDASPSMKLHPGDYTVNAAFGRANLTRKITVRADGPPYEAFILNAGGLRLAALVGGKPAPPNSISYSIFTDDRDQFDNRAAVLNGAKPNLIIRLNSGIYRIVSQYGDANARIEADVTVEAGKLTETTISHTGGKATFKLVARSGGEAMPDTRWSVQTADGDIVKESVGALPTHVLAPGKYVVVASSGGHLYRNTFEIHDGDVKDVEVIRTAGAYEPESVGASDIAPTTPSDFPEPTLDFKSR
ncbi:hypothetical protein DLM45_00485 [Hyphomicrobium methylovorum]|uniref:hypothetical protein n=1 Tax=Hyphomicrobium methylovorum TaxID=84 RepID=UPI0015E662CC|nr:hypothetical protein [Hyphomicrobium methylovorum]MBA2124707.1 hypothetical protein [Hyphomicrobium methylovorum]